MRTVLFPKRAAMVAASVTVAVSLMVAAQAPAQLCLPGAPLPATVLRDARGVPHIFAPTLDALNFTNGYVQAQDRLFEMEILRRPRLAVRSEDARRPGRRASR